MIERSVTVDPLISEVPVLTMMLWYCAIISSVVGWNGVADGTRGSAPGANTAL